MSRAPLSLRSYVRAETGNEKLTHAAQDNRTRYDPSSGFVSCVESRIVSHNAPIGQIARLYFCILYKRYHFVFAVARH